jgi:hypothetical protein
MPCRSSPKRLFTPVIGSSSSSIGSSSQKRHYYHTISDRFDVISTAALFPRVGGELHEHSSRPFCSVHRHREVDPGTLAATPEIDPFRIDTGHSPVSALATEQVPSAIDDDICVIFVHVRDYPGLCSCKLADVAGEYQVMAFDPPGLAEPGNEVSAVNDNPVKAKIAKTRVHRTGRMMRGKSREAARIMDRFSPPEQCYPRPSQRVGVTLGGVEQQGDPRVESDITTVLGETGEQQERARIEIGRNQHKRSVGGASQARGQRRALTRAQQTPAKNSRIAAGSGISHQTTEPFRRVAVKHA